MAHIVCGEVLTNPIYSEQWKNLNLKYSQPYDINSHRNFLPLCGSDGTSSDGIWSCHHLFDHHMFLLLPSLDKLKFLVTSLHPLASHLPKIVNLPYVPYRRGLAARAKLALKHCSPFVTDDVFDTLVNAIEYSDTSSTWGPAESS